MKRDLKVRVISSDEIWLYIIEPGNVERCVAHKHDDDLFYPIDQRGNYILPHGPITLAIAEELERITP